MYLIIILLSPQICMNFRKVTRCSSAQSGAKSCAGWPPSVARGSRIQSAKRTPAKSETSQSLIREFFKGMLFKFFWRVLFGDKEGDEHSFVPLQVKMHLMKCLKIKSATYLSVENKENNSWVSGHPHVPLDMYVTLDARFLGIKMY